MQRAERLTAILEIVARDGRVEVEQLIEQLGVSPATARRDLDALDEQLLLTRTRGGAVPHAVAYDLPLRYKNQQHVDEKSAIARAAAGMVARGSIVGLAGGTTSTAIADALMTRPDVVETADDPGLTVVTNAVNIAMQLAARPQIKTVLTGGVLHPRSYEVVGAFAETVLGGMNLDYAFISANGLDAIAGATAHDEREATTNALMAARAREAVLVVDSSKLGVRAFAAVGDHTLFTTVITDEGATAEQIAALEAVGYRIVIAA